MNSLFFNIDIKDEKYKEYLSEEMGYKVERLHRKKMMSIIFRFPEKLEDKEKEQLTRIVEEDSINKLYGLVQSFRIIIKERRLLELDHWINLAINSDIEELKIFAQGLQNDIESIRNALKCDYNNGV